MTKRILLADDSITIQKVVELTFSDGDYEVTAVNNGNKAIQKLSEMRPDIILSDIIMPEKNGYEVCEFVKSHPEYRNIPVILLTGTFEPFDPDRADKAGCDAVVTKPFESQSLIHKVEELIDQTKKSAPPPSGGGSTAFAEESPFAPEPKPAPAPAPPPPSPADLSTGTFPARDDVFATPRTASTTPTTETPHPPEVMGGETRAFPRMTFEDLPPITPSAPSEPPSPWDEPVSTGGETRAFPKMTFEDMQKMAGEPASPPPAPPPSMPSPEPSPWDSGPIKALETPSQEPSQSSSLWDEQPGGETRAFPKMSFDDLESMAAQAPPPMPEPSEIPSWSPPPSAPEGEQLPFTSTPVSAPSEPEPEKAAPAPAAASSTAVPSELSEEQIDRIARRVVELMSEQVIRNIAWEVIPDLAETVVKERIRQLESE